MKETTIARGKLTMKLEERFSLLIMKESSLRCYLRTRTKIRIVFLLLKRVLHILRTFLTLFSPVLLRIKATAACSNRQSQRLPVGFIDANLNPFRWSFIYPLP